MDAQPNPFLDNGPKSDPCKTRFDRRNLPGNEVHRALLTWLRYPLQRRRRKSRYGHFLRWRAKLQLVLERQFFALPEALFPIVSNLFWRCLAAHPRCRPNHRQPAGRRECPLRHSECLAPAAHQGQACPNHHSTYKMHPRRREWLSPPRRAAGSPRDLGRAAIGLAAPAVIFPIRSWRECHRCPRVKREQNNLLQAPSSAARKAPARQPLQSPHPWHCRHAAISRARFLQPKDVMSHTCRFLRKLRNDRENGNRA